MTDAPSSHPGWVEQELYGWGRYPRIGSLVARPESQRGLVAAATSAASNGDSSSGLIAHGLGRSYGDVALLRNGRVILTRRLDRMLAFDESTGVLRCEAGVSLEDLLEVFLPRGWFPPVLPGTKFVTVGGAVANDIHGKSHHADGTFCDHVNSIDLLLASGEMVTVSRDQHSELFWATVGGIGLTGIILAVEFALRRVDGPWFETESIRIRDLDHFFEVSAASTGFTHVVSWIDTLAKGKRLGRGTFSRGRHAVGNNQPVGKGLFSKLPLTVPIDLPNLVLNPFTLRVFNEVFYRKQWRAETKGLVHFEPWFFPLDVIGNWNRGYGPRGMIQYQIVVPPDPEHRAIRTVIEGIATSGMGSFLAVLKEFGDNAHGGLSFPMPGVTLALDFPNYGKPLFELLNRMDRVVAEAGGRVYLGKDSRLSKEMFQQMYPGWQEWKAVRDEWDPTGRFQSELGRRLGLVQGPVDKAEEAA